MKLRVRLGQYLDDTNLVTDGVFAAACGVNWVCGGFWNIAAGVASHTAGAGATLLYQTGVFTSDGITPNTRKYQINYEVLNVVGVAYIQPFIGGDSLTDFTESANGTYSIDVKHLNTSTELGFVGFDFCDLDNVSVYNYKWNDPLEDQPSFDNTKLKITTAGLLNSLLTTWEGEIVFSGDGYDYLKDIYDNMDSDEFCDRIDILIERYNDGWEKHFEGYIYLSNCEFNFKEKTVTIKKIIGLIEDVIEYLQNKEIKNLWTVSVYFYNTTTHAFIGLAQGVNFRQCGGAAWNDPKTTLNVGRTLEHTLHAASSMEVTLESSYFTAGTWQYFAISTDNLITNGAGVAGNDNEIIFITFDDFVANLDYIHNMGIIERFDDNIPTLVFEPKSNLGGTAQSFTFENVNAEVVIYNDVFIYSQVRIGFQESYTYSYWDAFDYFSEVSCSQKTSGKVCDWIADDQTIDDIRCVPQTFPNYIILCVVDNAGTLEARYIVGDAIYNDGITSWRNMTRQVWSLQSNFNNNKSNALQAVKTNDAFIREVEFDTKLTIAQLDAIRNNPNYLIQFTAPEYNLPATQEGYIIDFEFDNIKETAKFTLLI